MPLDTGSYGAPRRMSPAELRAQLAAAGYDLDHIDGVSRDLKVDLIPILAGWAPVLASICGNPASSRQAPMQDAAVAGSPNLPGTPLRRRLVHYWQQWLKWRKG